MSGPATQARTLHDRRGRAGDGARDALPEPRAGVRRWWLDRYTLDEIHELAAGLGTPLPLGGSLAYAARPRPLLIWTPWFFAASSAVAERRGAACCGAEHGQSPRRGGRASTTNQARIAAAKALETGRPGSP